MPYTNKELQEMIDNPNIGPKEFRDLVLNDFIESGYPVAKDIKDRYEEYIEQWQQKGANVV